MNSISIPFSFTSDTGAVATTSSINRIIEQQILDILSTHSGERAMYPRYGGGVKSLLFEELDPLVFSEYRVDFMQELNEYLTTGKVIDMSIYVPNENLSGNEWETSINISIRYAVPPFGSSVVTFNVSNSQTTILGGTR
jgi:hypothetical protein